MKRSTLENLRLRKFKVQQLRLQIAELEEMMLTVRTTKYSDMPKAPGGSQDRIGDLIAKKEELKQKYVDEIAQILDEQKEAEAFIDSLTDERYKIALKLRFCEGKTWFEVADILEYEVATIFTWWKKIVQSLD